MLKLINVSKTYDNFPSHIVLDTISCQVREGEFVAVVGPSGSGKTTLLNLLAGFDTPNQGTILFDDQPITKPGRDRAMIFQHYASFPWLSVAENIAFGLRLQNLAAEFIERRVNHYLAITGLTAVRASYPHTLSGGMRQRLAFARTLAANPRLVLLDEPFGALDVQTRAKMQVFLADLWQQEKKTMIFVTHDLEEAIFLADRVIVLSGISGKIAAEITINLPRPRRPELKFDGRFIQLKKELTAYFEEKSEKGRVC